MMGGKVLFYQTALLLLSLLFNNCGRERETEGGKEPAGMRQAGETVIKKDGAVILSLVRLQGSWEAASGGAAVKILEKPGGYEFSSGSETYQVKVKDDKIRLLNHDGNTVFTLKTGSEKIRFTGGMKGGEQWSFKLKEGKMKYSVRNGERESGTVKFHPGTKSVIASDEKGREVCRAESGKLILSPGVCLMPFLSDREKLLLFGLLGIAVP